MRRLDIKEEKGVTLVTIIAMIIVMAIIASVSIVGGVKVLREAKAQVKETNLSEVKAVVSRESAKVATSGVLTPANATLYGVKNAKISSVRINDEGVEEEVIKAIGDDWYLLDSATLSEMGIEYIDEDYVVNYKLNVVIPLSSTDNIHEEIEKYN